MKSLTVTKNFFKATGPIRTSFQLGFLVVRGVKIEKSHSL